MRKSEEISFLNRTWDTLDALTINELFDIEQDMWARREGLGEYVYCDSCNTTFSKQDIYWDIEKDIYKRTVSEVERILDFSHRCSCGWRLKHCYDREEYIPQMRERYSQDAVITIMFFRNRIVWFMDGYTWDFSKIYNLEFQSHYGTIWEKKLKEAIELSLWYKLPWYLFSCSSMGTREDFMNFQYIYLLLQHFFRGLPWRYDDITAITELNVWWSLHKIYASLWAQQVGLLNSPEVYENVSTSDVYTSDIFIQNDLWKIYRCWFENDLRTFLRRYQAIIWN